MIKLLQYKVFIMSFWSEKWESINKHESGGQAKTHLVRYRECKQDTIYVLKELNRQKDQIRRIRMYREFLILKTMQHSGIPRAVYSNVNKYENISEKLYIVMEYIEGETLEKYLESESSPIDFGDAVKFFKAILEIIKYCHENNVVHRDIKPDNIILRYFRIDDPVLVDFGQSFNSEEIRYDIQTPATEIMGNRFLSLPELSVHSVLKNDSRSDITMAFGVFFYCLTRNFPRILSDHNGKLPHQRHKIQISGVNNQCIGIVNRIFDTAFQPVLDYRYPTVESAISDIEILEETMKNDIDNSDNGLTLDDFLKQRKTAEITKKRTTIDIVDRCSFLIHAAQNEAVSKLGTDFSRIEGKQLRRYEQYVGGKTFSIRDKPMNEMLSFMVCGVMVGSEVAFISKQIPSALDDTIDYTKGDEFYRCNQFSINSLEVVKIVERHILQMYIDSKQNY